MMTQDGPEHFVDNTSIWLVHGSAQRGADLLLKPVCSPWSYRSLIPYLCRSFRPLNQARPIADSPRQPKCRSSMGISVSYELLKIFVPKFITGWPQNTPKCRVELETCITSLAPKATFIHPRVLDVQTLTFYPCWNTFRILTRFKTIPKLSVGGNICAPHFCSICWRTHIDDLFSSFRK